MFEFKKLAGQLTIEKLAMIHKKVAKMSSKVSSCAVTQKIKETKQKKVTIIKNKYGEFLNVLLSDEEYRKLEVRFGGTLKDRIEKLSCGIESKGYKYSSHYATILSWSRTERDFHPVPKPGKPVPSYQEPDKYIKGKFGHIARRS